MSFEVESVPTVRRYEQMDVRTILAILVGSRKQVGRAAELDPELPTHAV
jgi:hypothetical protein